MVIDLFYFNGEYDVLELRFNILWDYVDKFIIVEYPTTFSGKPKPFYYHLQKGRYKKWHNKITYEPMFNDFTEEEITQATNSPNTGNGEEWWMREFLQKEKAKKALKDLHDEDIVFISDVDEIWNPKVFHWSDHPYLKQDTIIKPKQLPYLYYLNQRTNEDWLGWSGTIVTTYKNIKDACINHLRTDSMTEYDVVENGGWHFNSIGGREQKQKAFSHPVYEDDMEWRRREVGLHIDESDWPQYLKDNREQWKHLLL
jgi:beta-1,4-mannosyl-glycoprotein beta-1,4-N-acetylglucosaminyltransferase